MSHFFLAHIDLVQFALVKDHATLVASLHVKEKAEYVLYLLTRIHSPIQLILGYKMMDRLALVYWQVILTFPTQFEPIKRRSSNGQTTIYCTTLFPQHLAHTTPFPPPSYSRDTFSPSMGKGMTQLRDGKTSAWATAPEWETTNKISISLLFACEWEYLFRASVLRESERGEICRSIERQSRFLC